MGRVRGSRTYRWWLIVLAGAVALAGPAVAPLASPPASPSAAPVGPAVAPAAALVPQVSVPTAAVTVLDPADPAALAVATSAALYANAPVAVLASVDTQATAAATAIRLGAPLLLTPPLGDAVGVRTELRRLQAGAVLTVGTAAESWAATGAAAGSPGFDAPPRIVTDERSLPPLAAPGPRPSLLVLATDRSDHLAAVATARAAGARVEIVPGGDPRTWPAGSARTPAEWTLALGPAFGSAERLAPRLAVAAAGAQLPGGGQLAFSPGPPGPPGRRMIALYGHPGTPALGVLGEQDLAASVARAQALAAEYQAVVDEPVVPAFEIIATVADAGPGRDGDFSAEATVEFLRPWVDAAEAAGLYVLLDLQPGRADFPTQARRYAELLARPHVGLALDPEWRLGPDERHREQIGSVSVEEINATAGWLADLTRDRALPQKVLMIHQFRTSMIVARERLDTSRDELAVLVHADGFGSRNDKLTTWTALHEAEPPGIHWGWKNFYDEDRPPFTPTETMAVGPTAPVFVSYQ